MRCWYAVKREGGLGNGEHSHGPSMLVEFTDIRIREQRAESSVKTVTFSLLPEKSTEAHEEGPPERASI
jgi:hypothetical protein